VGSAWQVGLVGRERLVLDLSCRKREGRYWVVTDRWQRFSELEVSERTLADLGAPWAFTCTLDEAGCDSS
jgi:phosphoribosylformimino-5-aminoimidazole carboxamide ribotide isomerase